MNTTEQALWDAMEDHNVVDTRLLLAAIGTPKVTLRYVAGLYGIAIRHDFGQTEWATVNEAILENWSLSGLKRIKRLAWGAVEALGA